MKKNKKGLMISVIIISIILIVAIFGAVFYFGGFKQSVVNSDTANSEIPCNAPNDCSTYLLKNGVSQENVNSVTFSCVQNKCVGTKK